MASAAPGFGRAGMPPTGMCESAYRSVEPDVGQVLSYAFTVKIVEKNRLIRWSREGLYPTRECCEQVRLVVADLAAQVQDARGATVTIDPVCR